jgi:hypothetical protein
VFNICKLLVWSLACDNWVLELWLPCSLSSARTRIILGITGFLHFFHCPVFYRIENTTFPKLDLFPSSSEVGEDTYAVGPLRKSKSPITEPVTESQWWRLALSEGPKWGVFSNFTWGRKQIQFPKRRVFYSLEYRTMEKVQKPSNSVLYTIVRTLQNLRIILFLA